MPKLTKKQIEAQKKKRTQYISIAFVGVVIAHVLATKSANPIWILGIVLMDMAIAYYLYVRFVKPHLKALKPTKKGNKK